MKQTVMALSLGLALSSQVNALPKACEHCAVEPGIPVNAELDEIAEVSPSAARVLENIDETKLTGFISDLCRDFDISAKTGANPKKIVKDRIMVFLNEPKTTPVRDILSQRFFSRYNNRLFCQNKFRYPSTQRPKQHLFKLFIDYRKDQDFYYEWFAVRGNRDRPNLNVVHTINGQGETVLDYIDYLIETDNKDLNPKELKKLKRRLRRYGARHAAELTAK